MFDTWTCCFKHGLAADEDRIIPSVPLKSVAYHSAGFLVGLEVHSSREARKKTRRYSYHRTVRREILIHLRYFRLRPGWGAGCRPLSLTICMESQCTVCKVRWDRTAQILRNENQNAGIQICWRLPGPVSLHFGSKLPLAPLATARPSTVFGQWKKTREDMSITRP